MYKYIARPGFAPIPGVPESDLSDTDFTDAQTAYNRAGGWADNEPTLINAGWFVYTPDAPKSLAVTKGGK